MRRCSAIWLCLLRPLSRSASLLAFVACACAKPTVDEVDIDIDMTQTAGPPLFATSKSAPPIPKGMVWIPGGALVAGTPPNHLPRKADQEMPGEQVILEGFLIDRFPYPNEQGAIPLTNVDRARAQALCEARSKRLCSELEWERACKGPSNFTYEYGNRYRQKSCGTGVAAQTRPSGYRVGCRSEFGVHDTHGGVWEWTDSAWGRGSKKELVAVRGGNGPVGDVVGRCANAEPRRVDSKSVTLGFRCCAKQRNSAEVNLLIKKGPALRRHRRLDRDLVRAAKAKLPEDVAKLMRGRGVFHIVRIWDWRPLANEEVIVAAGCSGISPRRSCGVLLLRRMLGGLDLLGWVDSGFYVPMVRLVFKPRVLYVHGGDKNSHFRRTVDFDWGRVRISGIQRNVRKPN